MNARADGEHPASLWTATATAGNDWPSLQGLFRADVAIVGGGFTGCAAALALALRGAKVALLESQPHRLGRVGSHGRTGHPRPQIRSGRTGCDARSGSGAAHGRRGRQRRRRSLRADRAPRHRLRPVRKGWLQPAISNRTLDIAARRCEQWARRGAAGQGSRSRADGGPDRQRPLPRRLEDRRAGNIQPLSFVRGLATVAQRTGATLFERSPATALRRRDNGWTLNTPQGEVTADKVLIATNGYTDGLWPDSHARSCR